MNEAKNKASKIVFATLHSVSKKTFRIVEIFSHCFVLFYCGTTTVL